MKNLYKTLIAIPLVAAAIFFGATERRLPNGKYYGNIPNYAVHLEQGNLPENFSISPLQKKLGHTLYRDIEVISKKPEGEPYLLNSRSEWVGNEANEVIDYFCVRSGEEHQKGDKTCLITEPSVLFSGLERIAEMGRTDLTGGLSKDDLQKSKILIFITDSHEVHIHHPSLPQDTSFTFAGGYGKDYQSPFDKYSSGELASFSNLLNSAQKEIFNKNSRRVLRKF